MVTLFIFGQSANIVILRESFFDDLILLLLGDRVYDVLKSVSAPIVTWDLNELLSYNLLQKMDPLMNLQIFDQFGTEVIAVVVHH